MKPEARGSKSSYQTFWVGDFEAYVDLKSSTVVFLKMRICLMTYTACYLFIQLILKSGKRGREYHVPRIQQYGSRRVV